jgi:hypothetical protein
MMVSSGREHWADSSPLGSSLFASDLGPSFPEPTPNLLRVTPTGSTT